MATCDLITFGTTRTEVPAEVVPTYIRKVEDTIRDLENDILVTQKQLQAAKAVLKALEAI